MLATSQSSVLMRLSSGRTRALRNTYLSATSKSHPQTCGARVFTRPLRKASLFPPFFFFSPCPFKKTGLFSPVSSFFGQLAKRGTPAALSHHVRLR